MKKEKKANESHNTLPNWMYVLSKAEMEKLS